MKTLRIGKEIFTADYIAYIGRVSIDVPKISKRTFMSTLLAIAGESTFKLPSALFYIHLITGEKIAKTFDFYSVGTKTMEEANKRIEELKIEFGFNNIKDFTKEKKEAVANNDYEGAARIRDKETKELKKIDEDGFLDRVNKDVVQGIISDKLREVAEHSRDRIEEYINEAEAPIEI